MWQFFRQAPVSELFGPRSHSSGGETMPSPQSLATHALVQASVSIRLPSSHPSLSSGPTVLCRLSPHTLTWQCAVQSALSALAPPLSHCSGPAAPGGVKLWLTLPSPHIGVVQSMLQPAVSVGVTAVLCAGAAGASSQISWCVPCALTCPSPQRLTMQSLRQSLSSPLPAASSHSSPGSMIPLPQRWSLHAAEQPGPPSHSSTPA